MKTQQIYSIVDAYAKRIESNKVDYSLKRGGLQRICESLEPGLTIVGGRPSMGCTSFVLSMAIELAKAGKCVLFYGHPHHKIEDKIIRYVGRKEGCSCPFLKDLPFHFAHMFYAEDFAALKSGLCEDIARLHPDYVFIDCLQDILVDNRLINSGMTPEEYLCRELRDLAYRKDIPIVAVARLNHNPEKRSGIEAKIPQLGDFNGGDLAYYAALAIFPYRPEYYHIYNDDRTGEDIRGYMYIYEGCDRAPWLEMRLRFDHHTARVYDPEQELWVDEDGNTPVDLPF